MRPKRQQEQELPQEYDVITILNNGSTHPRWDDAVFNTCPDLPRKLFKPGDLPDVDSDWRVIKYIPEKIYSTNNSSPCAVVIGFPANLLEPLKQVCVFGLTPGNYKIAIPAIPEDTSDVPEPEPNNFEKLFWEGTACKEEKPSTNELPTLTDSVF